MTLIGLRGFEGLAQRGRRLDLEKAERDASASSAMITHPLPQVVQTSRRWRSVTPFALPRFPNRGGGKPPRPRDLPESQLEHELTARGFPEPISIKRIEGYQLGLGCKRQQSSIAGPRSEARKTDTLERISHAALQRYAGQGTGGF